MGCGESKHAVATENVITKGKKNKGKKHKPPVEKPDAENEVKENGDSKTNEAEILPGSGRIGKTKMKEGSNKVPAGNGVGVENNGGGYKPGMGNNTGVGVGVVDDNGEVHGVIRVREDFNGNRNNDAKSLENENLKEKSGNGEIKVEGEGELPIGKTNREIKVPGNETKGIVLAQMPDIGKEISTGGNEVVKDKGIEGHAYGESGVISEDNRGGLKAEIDKDIDKKEGIVVSQHSSAHNHAPSGKQKHEETSEAVIVSGNPENNASDVKGGTYQEKKEGNDAKKEDVVVSQHSSADNNGVSSSKQDHKKTPEAVVVSGKSENDASAVKGKEEDNSPKKEEDVVSQHLLADNDVTLSKQDREETSEAVFVHGKSENDASDVKGGESQGKEEGSGATAKDGKDGGEDNSGKGKEKAPKVDESKENMMADETKSAVVTREEKVSANKDENAKTATTTNDDGTRAN